MLAEDCLLSISSDVLEDFSGMIVIVDLLLEELREASIVLNLSCARELLNDTNNITHYVLCLIVLCNIRHVLLEDFGKLIEKSIDLANNNNWGPNNKTMQDA